MILNLTQHPATPDQIAQGVVDLPPAESKKLWELLTFEELPGVHTIHNNAEAITDIACRCFTGVKEPVAMIGGAPFFMGPLHAALNRVGIKVVFAFSARESVEEKLPDGSVRKMAVFRHKGFVEGVLPNFTLFNKLYSFTQRTAQGCDCPHTQQRAIDALS